MWTAKIRHEKRTGWGKGSGGTDEGNWELGDKKKLVGSIGTTGPRRELMCPQTHETEIRIELSKGVIGCTKSVRGHRVVCKVLKDEQKHIPDGLGRKRKVPKRGESANNAKKEKKK